MGNVSEMGASAYLIASEMNRRLPEIGFEAGEVYVRYFLKTACKKGRLATDPGAEFINEELPSHVLIGEVLGEPVYNPDLGREAGFKVPEGKSALEVMDIIMKTILGMPVDCEVELSQEHKINFLNTIKEYYKSSRPEVINMTPEDMLVKTLEPLKESYDTTIKEALKSIVKEFSHTRTDIRTWVAPYQQVTFFRGRGGFERGSIKPREEDDGNDFNTCYALGSLMQDYSKSQFLLSETGQKYKNSMNDTDAIKAWRDWVAKGKETSRLVWGYPSNGLVHFCLSACCTLDFSSLKKDPATNRDGFVQGYYVGSSGSTGKTSKLLTALKTGSTNDDPDYFGVIMNYATSNDKKEAGQAMSVNPIIKENPNFIKAQPTVADIHDFLKSIIADKMHKKVRMFDEFRLTDNIQKLRQYVIEKNVKDFVDVSVHGDTLNNILGVATAISFDEAVNGVTNATTPVQPAPVQPAPAVVDVANAISNATAQAQNATPTPVQPAPMTAPEPIPAPQGQIPSATPEQMAQAQAQTQSVGGLGVATPEIGLGMNSFDAIANDVIQNI